ncbi:hypothetical protein XFEB_00014 [Xylella fastidiosa EB92.1]|nr:hypothetical protein XFEB_00014 [Xylella fastidiosa EB92.1]
MTPVQNGWSWHTPNSAWYRHTSPLHCASRTLTATVHTDVIDFVSPDINTMPGKCSIHSKARFRIEFLRRASRAITAASQVRPIVWFLRSAKHFSK